MASEDTKAEPKLNCWQSRNEWLEKHDFATYAAEFFDDVPDCCCMLPDGHDGPHEWTPIDEIVVSFKEAPQ